MTTADWFSVASQAMANFAAFLALYLTLVSAYLITAFVAGKTLSRSQVTVINAFFVLFAGFNLFAEAVTLRNGATAFIKASSSVEDMASLPDWASHLPLVTVILGTAMILACLKFMWDIRHPKPK